MKKRILEKVETLNERQLMELNNFVDNINNTPSQEYDLLGYVQDIVDERKEVLKKLVQ